MAKKQKEQLTAQEQEIYSRYLHTFDPKGEGFNGWQELRGLDNIKGYAFHLHLLFGGTFSPKGVVTPRKLIVETLGHIERIISSYDSLSKIPGSPYQKNARIFEKFQSYTHFTDSLCEKGKEEITYAVLAAMVINELIISVQSDASATGMIRDLLLDLGKRIEKAGEPLCLIPYLNETMYRSLSMELAADVAHLMEVYLKYSEHKEADKRMGSKGGKAGRKDYAGAQTEIRRMAAALKEKHPVWSHNRIVDTINESLDNYSNTEWYKAACSAPRLKNFSDKAKRKQTISVWIKDIVPPVSRRKKKRA